MTTATPDAYERVKDNLLTRHASLKAELAELADQLTDLTVKADADPSPETRKALSAAADKHKRLAAEYASIGERLPSIDKAFEEARAFADLQKRKAAAAEYVKARDAQAVLFARLVANADAFADDADEVRALSKTARQAAAKAWGRRAYPHDLAFGGELLDLLAEFTAAIIAGRRAPSLMDADRERLLAPWRPRHGEWADALAELTEA